MEAAEAATEAVKAARIRIPDNYRSFGVITCGAALGDKEYVAAFLDAQAERLCNDQDSETPGVIPKVTEALADESAQCASTAIYYSLQCRADFLLGTHLPSETRTLAAKVDDALRKAYARCFGADLLNAEGTWERQEDPTFHRDLMGLKASAGGGGYRNTARRAAFINTIANALPQMMGNETRQPLWSSLENVLGADSFKKNDVDTCWQTFFDSGSVWATEFKSEIARIKELRAQAIAAAGREATPNEIFDRPDNSFGFGVEKLHRQLFDEIRRHEAEALRLRAGRLPPDDPRKITFEQSRSDKFSNTLFVGTPDPLTPLTTAEFRSAVQNKMGAPQSALLALTGLPIDSSTRPAPTVDPSGYNLKKLQGAKQDGTRQNHDSFLDTLSRWLARAKIPHMGGKCGNPRTCKGLFSRISYRLAQMEEAADTADEDKAFKILQHIIPDLVINGRSLSGNGFLAGRKSVADLKTLSPCDPYSNDRTGNPNAVVNARQKKVNMDYHSRAKSLDARGGDTRDGFEAELNSYGQGGRVLGPVVGAFGEMSDDVKELANAVAEELAVEHCSFYGDKTSKVVKGFFLNQLYRSWGHTAHRGWARLLLDRRSLVQVPNAPRRRARADDTYYEENIMESYFHPEGDHHIGPGP